LERSLPLPSKAKYNSSSSRSRRLASVPLLFFSSRQTGLFGPLLAGSAVVSLVVFSHAFVSIWCFLAAILALYLCVILHNLPVESESPAQPPTPTIAA
jgi:hypothetical protein